jgi:4-diphosphocytidyl-2-C-methyl-D-erythritol kinase
MVRFPNCKINIGLQVLGKRADGYHDLQSIFYPMAIKDALEIIDHPNSNDAIFSASGLTIDGNPETNLCIKAYDLIKKDFPQLPGIFLHLHKAIPIGAGLGGGSADAAAMLQMLNNKYSLGMGDADLAGYALALGSDCPFFLINKPCIAEGRGEILEEISLDLSGYNILLVNPGIHINTSWAFSILEKQRSTGDLRNLIKLPIDAWKEKIKNDFEGPVCNAYPELLTIKEKMNAAGALYCSLSGSGSSFYGIFKKDRQAMPDFPAHYFSKWV